MDRGKENREYAETESNKADSIKVVQGLMDKSQVAIPRLTKWAVPPEKESIGNFVIDNIMCSVYNNDIHYNNSIPIKGF